LKFHLQHSSNQAFNTSSQTTKAVVRMAAYQLVLDTTRTTTSTTTSSTKRTITKWTPGSFSRPYSRPDRADRYYSVHIATVIVVALLHLLAVGVRAYLMRYLVGLFTFSFQYFSPAMLIKHNTDTVLTSTSHATFDSQSLRGYGWIWRARVRW
jgi:hypothetical protein